MATFTDSKEYPSYNPDGKLLKAATIGGKAGKQIKIESVSLQMVSGKDKVVNTTTVSINGTPYAIWTWDSVKYSDVKTYNKYPFVVDAGKDVKITWTVKTSDKKVSAKIKNISYAFSYVDAVTPVKNSKLIIECESSKKAAVVVADIKAQGVLKDGMSISVEKSG